MQALPWRPFGAFRREVLGVRWVSIVCWLSILAPEVRSEVRAWSARNGQRWDAELLAADGLRATLGLDGRPKWIVPLVDLEPSETDAIRAWRSGRRFRPLVDARLLGAWPVQATAENLEIRALDEDAGRFGYESANFRLTSDLRLPLEVARDLAMVFEATRNALIALPIGLHAGGEREKYSVPLTASTDAYLEAGGPPGSGGFYEARTRRMLVLLPNLGIEQKGGKLQLRYVQNVFVLKHEVTHQLLARWHGPWPTWLHEGWPEVMASLPYQRGRYALQNPTAGLREYLLKWRRGPNDRLVRLIPPPRLMAMGNAVWSRAVAAGAAYDLYNSAGLLTHYFLQQRGGAAIAGYLESLRAGENPVEAEKVHLLPGRTRESLTADLIDLGRKLGVEVKALEP